MSSIFLIDSELIVLHVALEVHLLLHVCVGVCKYFTLVFLALSSHKLCTLACSDITICSSSVIWTSSSKIAICCSTRTTTHPLDTADCEPSFGWVWLFVVQQQQDLTICSLSRQDITMATNIFHSYVHQYCEQKWKWMVEHNKIKGTWTSSFCFIIITCRGKV